MDEEPVTPGVGISTSASSVEGEKYITLTRTSNPERASTDTCTPKYLERCLEDDWEAVAVGHGIEQFPEHRHLHDNGCCMAIRNGFVNVLASIGIALRMVFNFECVLGCMLSVGCSLANWEYGRQMAVSMSWSIVSLAVIFPISQGIGMGFKRRESALAELGNLFGHLKQIWGAAHTWKVEVPEGSRQFVRLLDTYADPEVRRQQLRQLFEEFLVAIVTYFDTPRWSRARHAFSCMDAKEQDFLMLIARRHRMCVDNSVSRLQRVVQDMKCQGLDSGSCHRLDQYVSKIGVSFERLTYFKEYRTPQAFRSFARVYILCIAGLYGPYYIYLARGSDAFGMALAFGCAVQIAVHGLFNVMLGLEDPFDEHKSRPTDDIRMTDMVDAIREQLLQSERNASNEWSGGWVSECVLEASIKSDCVRVKIV